MTDWSFGDVRLLLLLLLLPVVGLLMLRFIRWKNSRKNLFSENRFQERIFQKPNAFSRFLPVLYLLGLLFLILAMVDLLSGKEEIKTSQHMNSVIFVLDISNSMNAEDVSPSRLVQAKNLMINTMQQMTNDKVGIVVFAGDAASIMPMTTDFTAAETYISAIETGLMKIQGTDFLKAVNEAARKFKNVPKGSRKVVLISDGEDNEGNDDSAGKLAGKEGIMVISVGIGTDEGAPVPDYMYGQLMGYKMDRMGQTVISKRQTEALRSIAERTGGSYIDGNNVAQAPAEIVEAVNRKPSATASTVTSQNANHFYQYPLALSILLFFLIYLLNPKRDFNL